jgi:hypothetical protein
MGRSQRRFANTRKNRLSDRAQPKLCHGGSLAIRGGAGEGEDNVTPHRAPFSEARKS